jgi:hypothetical protein
MGGRKAIAALCGAILVLGAYGIAAAAEIAEGIVLNGDLTVRNESMLHNSDWGTGDVHHGRMRFRAGLGFEIDDHWSGAVRVSTGRSSTAPFQDLDALNDECELFIDRAYIQYETEAPKPIQITTGRTPNPYLSSGMVWDSDYNPDGLCEKIEFPFTKGTFLLNLGQHVLSEDARSDYRVVFYGVQTGVKFPIDKITLTVATSLYSFHHVRDEGSVPAGEENYTLMDLYAKMTTKISDSVPFAAWIHGLQNTEASDDDTGFAIGVSAGSDKEFGKVKGKLEYYSLQQNAIWIDLGDSTFSSGLRNENMSGLIAGVSVGLGPRMKTSLLWFYKDSDDDGAHEDRILLDLMVKF